MTGTGGGGTNRSLSRLRALYNWGIRVGYVGSTPFKRGTEPVVRLSRETPRSRRLNADTNEEAALLATCEPHLRAVVEAALETAMRRGEILSLQWTQVEGLRVNGPALTWAPRAEIVLTSSKTKTRRERRIPISSRLRAILELRRFDPVGEPVPMSGFVFGNEIGQRVQSTKRAWNTAVLKAHGRGVSYTKTMNLSPESRRALAEIDLHFHDSPCSTSSTGSRSSRRARSRRSRPPCSASRRPATAESPEGAVHRCRHTRDSSGRSAAAGSGGAAPL